jgi:hypothetical protein
MFRTHAGACVSYGNTRLGTDSIARPPSFRETLEENEIDERMS